MSEKIRQPMQQRSIEKKNKIIEAGYRLFAQKGYFNTNTAEIAKNAGVSTGIVYGYFHDKRDIMLEALEIYLDNVFTPVIALTEKITSQDDIYSLIPQFIDLTEKTHIDNAAIHEALYALTSTDKTVNEKFLQMEKTLTEKIAGRLESIGLEKKNLFEKVHLAIEIIQSYSHECVYDKHSFIDYSQMRDLIIIAVKELFRH